MVTEPDDGPGVVPIVHVAAAYPSASVKREPGSIDPAETCHAKAVFALGRPSEITRIRIGIGSGSPTVPDCPSLAGSIAMVTRGLAVALKVTGFTIPVIAANADTRPGVAPSTQLVPAMPSAPVVLLPGVTLPERVVQVTSTPAAGWPSDSTNTPSGMGKGLEVLPRCPLVAATAMAVVIGGVRPPPSAHPSSSVATQVAQTIGKRLIRPPPFQ
jgi:hypothetical protein